MSVLSQSYRWRDYAVLMRLNRPIGILLLLWPTLWGLWIAASGKPDGLVLMVFMAGVVLMRSAGCVINDYADREFDPHVARTRERPIAAGRVSANEALLLFSALCLIAFSLVLLLNRLTIALSLVAAFLAASYPFVKRFTQLPQFYLGMAFGWSIPMAFAAQTGTVPAVAWILFAANMFWSVAYDTAYAMVDREDDLKVGVKSTAILFGRYDRFMILLCHMIALSLLTAVGIWQQFSLWYYSGLVVAAGFAAYQHALIYNREPKRCFQAFLNNNWFGLSIFLGLVGHFLFRS